MAIKITFSDALTGQVFSEFTIVDEQIKALSTNMISSNPDVIFWDWLVNAIQNKARQCIDSVVTEHSEFQPSKISAAQKLQIVRDAKVKSAAERQAEIEEGL